MLAALLVVTPLSTAQHVNFYRMSSNGCATGVKSDTGYSAPVIKYVWRKYRAQLINAARGYEGFRFVVNEGDDALAEYVGLCLYAALWYIRAPYTSFPSEGEGPQTVRQVTALLGHLDTIHISSLKPSACGGGMRGLSLDLDDATDVEMS